MDERGYEGSERRRAIILSDKQLDEIAERAATRVLEHFQREVGKVTIRAFLYVAGTVGVGVLSWFGIQKIGGG